MNTHCFSFHQLYPRTSNRPHKSMTGYALELNQDVEKATNEGRLTRGSYLFELLSHSLIEQSFGRVGVKCLEYCGFCESMRYISDHYGRSALKLYKKLKLDLDSAD